MAKQDIIISSNLKSQNATSSLATTRPIENLIYSIRDVQVILDEDIANLYGVETKRLNEQVKRNIERFPPEFMFQLTKEEWNFLRSQFATLNSFSQINKRIKEL